MSDFMTTIGEVAEVFDGPHATPTKVEDGPYFLSISSLENGNLDLSKSARLSQKDFEKWTRRVTPQSGDVLFSYETRLGDAALMPPNVTACLGRRMGLLRPKADKVIPEYLLYAYLSPEFQETIRAKTIHGATVDRIALKELPDFPIRIPPLEEQREVVKVLNAINSKLELNRQTNQTLEQIAQAIFKSWFVDFDPVRAKIAASEAFIQQHPEVTEEAISAAAGTEGDALAHTAAKACELAAMCAISGKSEEQLNELSADTLQQLKATAVLFPDRLVEMELEEVPAGWLRKQIADFVSFQNGYAFKSKDWKEEGVPVVKIGSVKPGIVDLSKVSYVSRDTTRNLERFRLQPGDMLVGMSGYPGETGLVPITDELPYLNQRVGRVSAANGSDEYYSWIYCLLRDPGFKKHAESMAHGSAQANVSGKALVEYVVTFSSRDLLTLFNGLIKPMIMSYLRLSSESDKLKEIRDELLPRLLAGNFDA